MSALALGRPQSIGVIVVVCIARRMHFPKRMKRHEYPHTGPRKRIQSFSLLSGRRPCIAKAISTRPAASAERSTHPDGLAGAPDLLGVDLGELLGEVLAVRLPSVELQRPPRLRAVADGGVELLEHGLVGRVELGSPVKCAAPGCVVRSSAAVVATVLPQNVFGCSPVVLQAWYM